MKKVFLSASALLAVVMGLSSIKLAKSGLISQVAGQTKISTKPEATVSAFVPAAEPSAASELDTAIALIDRGQWQTAEPMLRALLAKDPTNVRILNELVTINFADKKDYQSAIRFLEALIVQHPDAPFVFDRYQEIVSLGHAIPEALTFLQGLSLPEDHASAYKVPFTIGKLQMEQENHSLAKSAFDEALHLNSKEKGRILQYAAQSLVKLNDLDQAQGYLERSIEEYQSYNDTHTATNKKNYQSPLDARHQLLDVYMKNGKHEDARLLLEQLLQKDSQNPTLIAYQTALEKSAKP